MPLARRLLLGRETDRLSAPRTSRAAAEEASDRKWEALQNAAAPSESLADHLIEHVTSNALMTRPLDGSDERPQALVTYIESMRRTRGLPAEIVLSGHGEVITDHVALIDERFERYRRRAERIHELLVERPRSGYELAQALWGNVAVTQAFLTTSEVLGHLDLLMNEGRVREVSQNGVLRYEAVR